MKKLVNYKCAPWSEADIAECSGFSYGMIDTDKIVILGQLKNYYSRFYDTKVHIYYRVIIFNNLKIVVRSEFENELLIDGWDKLETKDGD